MIARYDETIRTINELTVHAGVFHSDDVFCGAVARILNEEAVVNRVNDATELENDLERGIIVADIGRKEFDHHQPDCPDREDGIKHCGASRLWFVYGISVVDKLFPALTTLKKAEVCDAVYRNMLRTIAALDNNVENFPKDVYSVVTIVEAFRPTWNEDATYDEGYFEAVKYMKLVLSNEIRRYAAEVLAADIVESKISEMKDGIVILDKLIPWKTPVIKCKSAKIVIYPSLRGGFNLEPVPNEIEEITYRVDIPAAWRGLSGDEAGKHFKGMTFCHRGGFVLAFKTREDAVACGKYLVCTEN